MSSAIALAVIVTQPGRKSKERARLLVEHEELAGKSWVDGSAEAVAAGEAEQLAAARKAAAAVAEADAEIYEPKLTGRAACVAAASIDPAPVHGWVKKTGPLPMGLLDGPQTLRRHQAYFDWRDAGASNASLLVREAQVDGKPALVGRTPPLFPYCRVLVNHVYRTMYLKAPKTGSTSLLTLLGTCTGGPNAKATCFEPLKVKSKQEYEQLYSDYFVYTVVRNPWNRAVSSYRMLSRYMARACEPLVGGWNTVCMDLNHLGRLHHNHPECTLHKQQGEGFAMHHLIPQAPCLVTAGGEWAADYVVRTERMEEDMREVLTQMNARRQADAEPLDVDDILGQLTNVNKVHVACHGGLTADAAAAEVSRRRSLLGQQQQQAQQLQAQQQPQSPRRGLLEAPLHLEAPESYCNEGQYFIGLHSRCFDALRAYYAQDMQLFELPACLDEAPAAATAAATVAAS